MFIPYVFHTLILEVYHNPLDKERPTIFKQARFDFSMVLMGIIGSSSSYVNHRLLMYASNHAPSLVIDCANAANPHSLYPAVPMEKMSQVYVIELELLYKFRDVLLRVPSIIKKMYIKSIVITTSDHLFNYQDKIENHNIIQHSWELMRAIGNKKAVLVGLTPSHLKYAKKYCHKLGVVKNRAYSIKPAHDG